VKSGDEIEFGRYSVEVRQTPGHTNGKQYNQIASSLNNTRVKE